MMLETGFAFYTQNRFTRWLALWLLVSCLLLASFQKWSWKLQVSAHLQWLFYLYIPKLSIECYGAL